MTPCLISLDYRAPHRRMALDQLPAIIGHGQGTDIQLDDLSVSNRHCEITTRDGVLMVRDFGSAHGTFVNGRAVSESVLEPGDELSVGMLTFLVRYNCHECNGGTGNQWITQSVG